VQPAERAGKLELRLDVAREKVVVATDLTAVTILKKPAGTFRLTFRFQDGTEVDLDETELDEGDVIEWSISKLLLSNPAQSGLVLKLLVDYGVV